MGGRPLLAMNIICFPSTGMDISILQEILRGGFDKMQESGVLLVGGHSVDDNEIKYGLSVTGTVHPNKVLKNIGGRPGDVVILTKPLGTGIISTAIKAGMVDKNVEKKVIKSMKSLNKKSAELMDGLPVHACTDVTGFGLLGHACEMIEGLDVGMRIFAARIPVFAKALEYARMGLIPGGTYRNQEYRASMVDIEHGIDEELVKVLFDPQTSGGLLIVLPDAEAGRLLSLLHAEGIRDAALVGEITPAHAGRIKVGF
jgi:selenide,water dikinase